MSKILFTSIPKCGTHLLLKYLDHLQFPCAGPHSATSYDAGMLRYVQKMPENTYTAFHYPWTEALSNVIRERRIKVVFLYRDPRAQVASRLHFLRRSPEHPFTQFMDKWFAYPDEWLLRIIRGFEPEALAAYPGADLVAHQLRPPLRRVAGRWRRLWPGAAIQ